MGLMTSNGVIPRLYEGMGVTAEAQQHRAKTAATARRPTGKIMAVRPHKLRVPNTETRRPSTHTMDPGSPPPARGPNLRTCRDMRASCQDPSGGAGAAFGTARVHRGA